MAIGDLQIVSIDDITSGRGKKRGAGPKYAKYQAAISKAIPEIKELIANSKDGYFRVKVADIAKEMGSDFPGKNPTSIYWGLKFTLFQEGIVVDMRAHKNGVDKVLMMRTGTKDDKLPESLAKFLNIDDQPGSTDSIDNADNIDNDEDKDTKEE